MFPNYHDVFWILEYAKKDKIGRLHSWQSGGIARSEDELAKMVENIQTQFACEVRSHRYSHALGKNA